MLVASIRQPKIDNVNYMYLLTFLLLILPFGLIWFVVYRYLKEYIKTILNYSVLILFTLVGLTAYFGLTGFLLSAGLKQPIGSLILSISWAVSIFSNILIAPTIVVVLILTINHHLGRHKNEDLTHNK